MQWYSLVREKVRCAMPNDDTCSQKIVSLLKRCLWLKWTWSLVRNSGDFFTGWLGPGTKWEIQDFMYVWYTLKSHCKSWLLYVVSYKLQPKIASWTADQLQGLGQIRFQVEKILRGRNQHWSVHIIMCDSISITQAKHEEDVFVVTVVECKVVPFHCYISVVW